MRSGARFLRNVVENDDEGGGSPSKLAFVVPAPQAAPTKRSRRPRAESGKMWWTYGTVAVMTAAELRGAMIVLQGGTNPSTLLDQWIGLLLPVTYALIGGAVIIAVVGGWRCLEVWSWVKFVCGLAAIIAGALLAGAVGVLVCNAIATGIEQSTWSLFNYLQLDRDIVWLTRVLLCTGLLAINVATMREIHAAADFRSDSVDGDELQPLPSPLPVDNIMD